MLRGLRREQRRDGECVCNVPKAIAKNAQPSPWRARLSPQHDRVATPQTSRHLAKASLPFACVAHGLHEAPIAYSGGHPCSIEECFYLTQRQRSCSSPSLRLRPAAEAPRLMARTRGPRSRHGIDRGRRAHPLCLRPHFRSDGSAGRGRHLHVDDSPWPLAHDHANGSAVVLDKFWPVSYRHELVGRRTHA
jgi:hypothetical protein